MHFIYAVSLLTANWKGDVLIIAAGVFLGRFAWGLIEASAETLSRRGQRRDLETTIARAIARARAADQEERQVY